METGLDIAATLAGAGALPLVWRAKRSVSGTTLVTAWIWTVAAAAAWGTAWLSTSLTGWMAPGAADQAWYAVSLLGLCPSIAVLGSRRPGVGAWNGFVLVPLLLVLGWPAMTHWNAEFRFDRLQLQEPVVAGYALVMLMGLGNYFGTRRTAAALLLATALVLLVAPMSLVAPSVFPTPERARAWATLAASASICVSAVAQDRSSGPAHGWDHLWQRFRELYGIVWTRRFMDRVNEIAGRERWSARLAPHGIEWLPPTPGTLAREETAARIDRTLHWLLKRFADPAWIDAQLAVQGTDGGIARTAAKHGE